MRKKFRGKSGIFQAVLLGVPLPLCSCGVIPAGIGLRKQGASNGSSVGFLISTPQTGVDSILVSAAMLGWPFAIFKMVTAAITGIAGGLLTDMFVSDKSDLAVVSNERIQSNRWYGGFQHAIEIIRSIWIWLVVGVLVSAVISAVLPDSVIQTVASWGPLAGIILALLIALPLYVCATASVPIAAALIASGMPPGAALVFLMAGPATNIATISAVASQFGKKVTSIYLLTVVIGSVLFALLFDWLIGFASSSDGHLHVHVPNLTEVLSAIALLGLFVWFLGEKLRKRFKNQDGSLATDQEECCH